MSELHPITVKIHQALARGARELKSSCEGCDDALGYVQELCQDVNSDLELGFDGDPYLEGALRSAAKLAIEQAYGRY